MTFAQWRFSLLIKVLFTFWIFSYSGTNNGILLAYIGLNVVLDDCRCENVVFLVHAYAGRFSLLFFFSLTMWEISWSCFYVSHILVSVSVHVVFTLPPFVLEKQTKP